MALPFPRGVYSTPANADPAAAVTITGLALQNDSPTALMNVTHFTATSSLIETVTYDWCFGDGTTLVRWAGYAK